MFGGGGGTGNMKSMTGEQIAVALADNKLKDGDVILCTATYNLNGEYVAGHTYIASLNNGVVELTDISLPSAQIVRW